MSLSAAVSPFTMTLNDRRKKSQRSRLKALNEQMKLVVLIRFLLEVLLFQPPVFQQRSELHAELRYGFVFILYLVQSTRFGLFDV